jgi:two-component system LytT family response regulator
MPVMLRTLIIDDEAHNRDTLQKMLTRYCPQVFIVGEAGSVSEGFARITELCPDLVFLDIIMQDGTGYDLLHSIKKVDFCTILISAGDPQMTIPSKQSYLCFLSKPINPTELITAVKRAEKPGPASKVGCKM